MYCFNYGVIRLAVVVATIIGSCVWLFMEYQASSTIQTVYIAYTIILSIGYFFTIEARKRRASDWGTTSMAIVMLVLMMVNNILMWAAVFVSELGRGISGPPGADDNMSWSAALYFSMTIISTTGFGDFYPTNQRMRLYVVVMYTQNMWYYVYAIGYVLDLLRSKPEAAPAPAAALPEATKPNLAWDWTATSQRPQVRYVDSY